MRRALGALLSALLTASCGASLMKLPAGPGTPAADGRAALDDATGACRGVTSITAEIGVRGSVRHRGLRARLLAGLRAPASARLEAAAPFGAPLFILVADGPTATLLLPRDGRVLEHGSTPAVLEAIAGIPLDASALRMTITGCTLTADPRGARRLAENWLLVPDGAAAVYLNRKSSSGSWRVAAVVHDDQSQGQWRAEYQNHIEGLPRVIRLTSGDGGFDLQLSMSQVDVNVPIQADTFSVRVPAEALPITVNELADYGPFAARDSRGR